MLVSAGLGVASISASAGAQVIDNFQSYNLGFLPSPLWHDVGTVLPNGRIPPIPSAYVISTTDAHGNLTQAVTTTGALATSKGIWASVPVSNFYSLFADVRVDRYSDAPSSTTADWAMQLSFGQNGVYNWASTPQVGLYASSLTQEWRLYAATNSVGFDISLGVAANVGTWYTVSQTFDGTNGVFHSQIWNATSGTQLLDTFNTLTGWNPADSNFDAFAFFGGDLSAGDTYGNIGVVDNVNVSGVTTPEPATLALLAACMLPLVGVLRRRK